MRAQGGLLWRGVWMCVTCARPLACLPACLSVPPAVTSGRTQPGEAARASARAPASAEEGSGARGCVRGRPAPPRPAAVPAAAGALSTRGSPRVLVQSPLSLPCTLAVLPPSSPCGREGFGGPALL